MNRVVDSMDQDGSEFVYFTQLPKNFSDQVLWTSCDIPIVSDTQPTPNAN